MCICITGDNIIGAGGHCHSVIVSQQAIALKVGVCVKTDRILICYAYIVYNILEEVRKNL